MILHIEIDICNIFSNWKKILDPQSNSPICSWIKPHITFSLFCILHPRDLALQNAKYINPSAFRLLKTPCFSEGNRIWQPCCTICDIDLFINDSIMFFMMFWRAFSEEHLNKVKFYWRCRNYHIHFINKDLGTKNRHCHVYLASGFFNNFINIKLN